MFAFLKGIFRSLTPNFPVIHPLEFSDGLLAFRCDASLPFERLTVASLTAGGAITARLEIFSYDDANRVYRAQLEDCQQTLDLMQLPARATRRLPLAVRVSSRQLPQYFALTEEVSTCGVRLVTASALREGTLLEMSLDLDDPALPVLQVQGEVRWSAMKGDGRYHSGVRFCAIDGPSQRALERYIEQRLESHRTVHGEG